MNREGGGFHSWAFPRPVAWTGRPARSIPSLVFFFLARWKVLRCVFLLGGSGGGFAMDVFLSPRSASHSRKGTALLFARGWTVPGPSPYVLLRAMDPPPSSTCLCGMGWCTLDPPPPFHVCVWGMGWWNPPTRATGEGEGGSVPLPPFWGVCVCLRTGGCDCPPPWSLGRVASPPIPPPPVWRRPPFPPSRADAPPHPHPPTPSCGG